jgi:hypothetical protein
MNRYLTTVERTFLHMAERIVMNPVVLVRCRGELEPAQVERAIARVQARHPALQLRLVRDERPWFTHEGVPPAPLRVLERDGDEHWREVVRAELNEPFEQDRGPLIRFTLLHGSHACELICTTDHLNADGRSGLYVLRDVLLAIDDPRRRFVPLEDRACFDEHLPGGLWELGRVPAAVRGILADGARGLARVARGFASERARLLGVVAPPASERPRIESVHQRLGCKRTRALVEVCRARGTTVQAALMVAASHALASAKRAYARPRATARVGCITPIDIRSALTPPVGDHFGIFAWAPTTVQSLAPGSAFWPASKWSRERLRLLHGQAALAGLRRLLDVHELGLAADLERLSALPLSVCDATVTVSNLGRVTLPRSVAGVEVLAFGFYAMIPDCDVVAAVATLDQLELNYCYSPSRIATATVREMVTGVADIIDAAIGQPARGAATTLSFT